MSNGHGQGRRSLLARLFSIALLLDILAILVAITYLGLQQVGEQVRVGIVEGVAANLITTSTFTILGVTAFIWLSVSQRRRLFRFFGVNRRVLGVRIYLSQLQVQPGGTKGTEPVSQGFTGPAIVKMEYDAGLLLVNLFRPRALALVPDLLRELLSAISVTLADVDVDVEIAPTLDTFSRDLHVAQNLITCGGAIYNAISHYYLNQDRSFYFFATNADGERVIKVRDNSATGLEGQGRASGHELACIQRLKDPEFGTTVFICAGLGSGATYGSVDYLVSNWRRLLHRYGDKEFGICLAFKTTAHDEPPTVQPKEIHHTSRPHAR
jgi:hypothetical protein